MSLQSHYEKIGAFFGESDEMPAPCSHTVDLIKHGPCDCPWEDHSELDLDPPF